MKYNSRGQNGRDTKGLFKVLNAKGAVLVVRHINNDTYGCQVAFIGDVTLVKTAEQAKQNDNERAKNEQVQKET